MVIFLISPFICLQWRYNVIIPLLQIWGHCFGFGWEGEEEGCVGVGSEVKGAFGVGVAPIKS